MKPPFPATIRFLTTAEGGRSTVALSGVRPQLKLGDVNTSCVVASTTDADRFELGVEYEVLIDIPFWEVYGASFDASLPIELFDGSRVIACGRWIISAGTR